MICLCHIKQSLVQSIHKFPSLIGDDDPWTSMPILILSINDTILGNLPVGR